MSLRKEALRRDHLRGFNPVGPMYTIPEDQFGQGVAYVRDGVVLAIVGGWHHDGAEEIGLLLSVEAKRFPVTMHRAALDFLRDLDAAGYPRLRAFATEPRSREWLERLGFTVTNAGSFERCPNQQP